MNRELRLALGLCLLGAVVLLVAGGRTWAVVEGTQPAPLPDVRTELTGAALVPGLRALAVASLAGAAAVLAARPRWRPLVGLLLAVLGAGAAAAVLPVLRDPAAAVEGAGADAGADAAVGDLLAPVAPLLAVLGAVLVLLAGLLVLLRGRRWAGLAARYDAPAARRPAAGAAAGSASTWDDLDRGVDPTAAGSDPDPDPISVQTPTRQQEETP